MNKAFVVCGSPGSGKSCYGRQLSKNRSAVLLDIDLVTERLIRAGLRLALQDPDDRDSDVFKKTFRQPIYETLFDIARENLRWNDVVIVGPFTKELLNPQWPSELREKLQTPVEVHYVYCASDIRRERLSRRANPRDAAKLRDWRRHIQYYGSEQPPHFPHVYIDTSN
ncbi:MAG: AAA family ATPase [Nitrospirota bacterium]|nr:MAG: AAA family ATPase [Nitrospirota bacterium]